MRTLTARQAVRGIAATLATGLALVGLSRLSAAPVPYHSASATLLRLSWSARPERIEVCRALSREELEEREEHMRQRVECDGRFATYDLRVTIDGESMVESVVRGGGLRHDRSMYLLREVEIPSGKRHVQVTFTRKEVVIGNDASLAAAAPATTDTGIFAGRATREVAERARRARAAVPARLVLDTTISLGDRRVLVITFDHVRRALVIVDGTGGVAPAGAGRGTETSTRPTRTIVSTARTTFPRHATASTRRASF